MEATGPGGGVTLVAIVSGTPEGKCRAITPPQNVKHAPDGIPRSSPQPLQPPGIDVSHAVAVTI